MYCDIHQHCVFGVDDGAKDIAQSKAMIKAAIDQGVLDIICTSHITPGSRQSLDIDKYYERLAMLREWLRGKSLSTRLHSGSEILYTGKTPAMLEAGRVPTLDDTANVLVEFLPTAPFGQLKRAAVDISNAGFDPIYAHVERYDCLREGDLLVELREEYGVRMQMNAATVIKNTGLIGGDSWVKKALKHQLIDFVASDAHNTTTRSCRIADAHAILTKKYGSEYADQLCVYAPASLLRPDDH